MLKILITFICFYSFFIITTEKEGKESCYIESLALTFQNFQQQGSQDIWPGFTIIDQPTVFHFKNGHVYAFGLIGEPSLWEKHVIQGYPVLYCDHYPLSLVPLHPAFSLEKQQAFVFSLDYEDNQSFVPLLTFVHERFHLHQFEFFYQDSMSEPRLEDYQNLDSLTWMEIENRLLTLFLMADEEEKLEHLKNYLAISQMRRQTLHLSSLQWEDHQQKMEGLADYVSVRTYQVFSCIPNFNAERALLEMRQQKNQGQIYSAQDIRKGRHYFVGAVLGLALDFCGIKNWKKRIENEKISLHSMLEEYLMPFSVVSGNDISISNEERLARIEFAQTQENLSEIRDQIAQQLQKERDAHEWALHFFHHQKGMIIYMGTPSGHMSSGGRHEKLYQIGRRKVLTEDTSLAASQDQLWVLRFQNIPFVFEEPNGDRIFKSQSNARLKLNGKEILVEQLLREQSKEISFSSLSFKDDYCHLSSRRAGKLYIEHDCIFFKFD